MTKRSLSLSLSVSLSLSLSLSPRAKPGIRLASPDPPIRAKDIAGEDQRIAHIESGGAVGGQEENTSILGCQPNACKQFLVRFIQLLYSISVLSQSIFVKVTLFDLLFYSTYISLKAKDVHSSLPFKLYA